MAQDLNIIKYTSKVIIGAEYAQANSIRDIDGRVIESHRELRVILRDFWLPENLKNIANIIPHFIRIPHFILDILNSKY